MSELQAEPEPDNSQSSTSSSIIITTIATTTRKLNVTHIEDDIWVHGDSDKDPEIFRSAYEAAEVTVPMIVSLLVVVVLCLVVGHTKYKRRQRLLAQRAAAAGHTLPPAVARHGPMPNISGGVPMSVSALPNYFNQQNGGSLSTSGLQPNEMIQPPPYSHLEVELPPSYEECIKNQEYDTGIVNMSFQSSSENLTPSVPNSSTSVNTSNAKACQQPSTSLSTSQGLSTNDNSHSEVPSSSEIESHNAPNISDSDTMNTSHNCSTQTDSSGVVSQDIATNTSESNLQNHQ